MKLLYRVCPLLAVYIPQTFVVWWAGLDSNQRIPKEWNLQSHAIAAMRPTHIEAEGWHRRSVSLTALIYYCFWLASRSYRLLFDNTACLHLLTRRSLAGVAGFEPASTRVMVLEVRLELTIDSFSIVFVLSFKALRLALGFPLTYSNKSCALPLGDTPI